MKYLKVSDVRSVNACYGGTAVTITMNDGESMVVSGTVMDIRAFLEEVKFAQDDCARRDVSNRGNRYWGD